MNILQIAWETGLITLIGIAIWFTITMLFDSEVDRKTGRVLSMAVLGSVVLGVWLLATFSTKMNAFLFVGFVVCLTAGIVLQSLASRKENVKRVCSFLGDVLLSAACAAAVCIVQMAACAVLMILIIIFTIVAAENVDDFA